MPVQVVHIIPGLGIGGAENFLLTLLKRIDRERYPSLVVGLKRPGIGSARFRALGIPVHELGLPSMAAVGVLSYLRQLLRGSGRSIVHCWMYHANLIGGLAAHSIGNRRIIWSLRQTNLAASYNRWSTRLVARCGGMLSAFVPRVILCNSQASRESHERFGYASSRMRVLANGVDTTFFTMKHQGMMLRRAFGIPDGALVLGQAARWDPVKGHGVFMEALSQLSGSANVHALFCGPGITAENMALISLARKFGIESRCHWLGDFTPMPDFYSALNVYISPSLGESFPNTLAEAMSCGLPCVATDVGESRVLVGDTGWIVAPGQAAALREAIADVQTLTNEERYRRGMEARRRVVANYDFEHTIRAYQDIYDSMAE